MKILITGATGLIGNAVLKAALKKNFKVNYLTRDKGKIKNSIDCNGFFWDVNNDYIDLKCFEGVNVIINLVGEKIFQKWTKKSKKEILSSRIKPIDLLLKGIKKSNEIGIRSFVSASAIGIYQNDFEKNYTENETVDPENFIQKTVYQWEKKSMSVRKLIPCTSILRIGLVLSKKYGYLKETDYPMKFGIGIQLGSGNQWQSWIHIDDIANIFLFIAGINTRGIYNAVAPKPLPQKLFLKKIRLSSYRKFIIIKLPSFLLKFFFGERASILLDSQRVSSIKILELGYDFVYKEVDEALNNLYNRDDNLT